MCTVDRNDRVELGANLRDIALRRDFDPTNAGNAELSADAISPFAG
jgi:hypothetical protein